MSCPDCFTGTIHINAEPSGTILNLHGRQTYVANPPTGTQPKGIVIIIPDAFGLPFVNNQLLADTYAREGPFKVLLPDFMDSTPAPIWMQHTFPAIFATSTLYDWLSKPYHIACALYGFIPFIYRHNYTKSMPKVTSYFSAVRAANPTFPIAAAGFCWGGQHTIYMAHGLRDPTTNTLYADACFTAHPSNVVVPRDIEKVTRNLSIAAAGKDKVMTIDQARQAEAILRQITEKTGVPTEVQYYPDATHGFGVRGDPTDKHQEKHMKVCTEQAVRWFQQRFEEWTPGQ